MVLDPRTGRLFQKPTTWGKNDPLPLPPNLCSPPPKKNGKTVDHPKRREGPRFRCFHAKRGKARKRAWHSRETLRVQSSANSSTICGGEKMRKSAANKSENGAPQNTGIHQQRPKPWRKLGLPQELRGSIGLFLVFGRNRPSTDCSGGQEKPSQAWRHLQLGKPPMLSPLLFPPKNRLGLQKAFSPVALHLFVCFIPWALGGPFNAPAL